MSVYIKSNPNGMQKKPVEQKNNNIVGQITPYLSMAGAAGMSAIDSTNTSYNLEFGGQSEAAKQGKNAIIGQVAEKVPVVGGIISAANSIGGMIGSSLNKNNRYNKYGYNENENFGEFYMGLGGVFDPFSMATRSLEQGGEGSGLRAIASISGIGGAQQYRYEQKLAKEKQIEGERIESAAWKLNQFNYNPIKDV